MTERPKTTIPDKADVVRFIEVFEALDAFESQHRSIRGWGVFKPEDVPDQRVVRVMGWLHGIAK